jgi:hypothetical protein
MRKMIGTALGVLGALVSASAGVVLSGCEGPDNTAAEAGSVQFALTAPSDVQCVRVAFAGGRTVTQDIKVSAVPTTRIDGLPIGPVTVTALAYPGGCGSAEPVWIADPVTVQLTAGRPAYVSLVFRQNGIGLVTAHFIDDKLADGQACALASDCASNACTRFHLDADNDGYGNGVAFYLCGTTAPSGYAAWGQPDCCDQDSRVHPNQLTCFSTPSNCGDFNYDCDAMTWLCAGSEGGCASCSGGVFRPGWCNLPSTAPDGTPQCVSVLPCEFAFPACGKAATWVLGGTCSFSTDFGNFVVPTATEARIGYCH